MREFLKSNIKKKYYYIVCLSLLLIFCSTQVVVLGFFEFFEVANFQIIDYCNKIKYKIHGKGDVSPYIAHVDLNDESAVKNNVSIWDRTVFASLIDILRKAGVKTIAVDIIFPEATSSANDQPLINASKEFDSIFYPIVLIDTKHIFKISRDDKTEAILSKNLIYPLVKKKGTPYKAYDFVSTFNALSLNSKGLGHKNSIPEKDGIYRRYPLIYSYKDGFVPSLVFYALCDYLEVDTNKIEIYFNDKIILPDAKFPGNIKKNITIPIDNYGRMIINFIGEWNNSFYHYSFDKILDIKNNNRLLTQLKSEIQDNFVVVSDNTTLGLINDTGPVPLESFYPLSGLHTNIANSILIGRIPRMMPIWVNFIIDFLFIILIILSGFISRRSRFSIFSISIFLIFMISCFYLIVFQLVYVNIIRIILLFLLSFCFINIYFYITENKYYNNLQARLFHADKLISLGVLAASVSHEINGPNNVIVNYSNLAENILKALTPVLDDYHKENGDFSIGGYNYSEYNVVKKIFDGINENTKKISGFANNFKNFSKNYGLNEKPQPVNINDIIVSSIELLQGQIKKSTSCFITDLDNSLPLARGIYHRLEQAFVNLIQNACNALESKNKEIRVATKHLEEKRIIEIEIKDQGVGIENKNLELVTDPFFTTRLEKGGTGLGLYITKNIITEHKGSIRFFSKVNEGTRVIVTLPAL